MLDLAVLVRGRLFAGFGLSSYAWCASRLVIAGVMTGAVRTCARPCALYVSLQYLAQQMQYSDDQLCI